MLRQGRCIELHGDENGIESVRTTLKGKVIQDNGAVAHVMGSVARGLLFSSVARWALAKYYHESLDTLDVLHFQALMADKRNLLISNHNRRERDTVLGA